MSEESPLLLDSGVDRVEISLNKLVNLKPQACYDAWMKVVFIEGGGLGVVKIESRGDENTDVGLTRLLAGGMLRERILSTDRPNQLEYSVLDGLPVTYYRGVVTFKQMPEDKFPLGATLVEWTVNYDPTWIGSHCCCLLKPLVRRSLTTLLTALANSAPDVKKS